MTSDQGALSDITVVIACWGSYVENLDQCLDSVPPGVKSLVVGDSAAGAVAQRRGVGFRPMASSAGISGARQLGLRNVATPFVCFLDADDRLLDRGLQTLAVALTDHREAIAAFGYLVRADASGRWPDERWARLTCHRGGAVALLFRNSVAAVDACLIRVDRVRDGVLFPELEDEDWHAAVRLRTRGEIVEVREDIAWYDNRTGSASRRPRNAAAVLASHDALVHTAIDAGAWPPVWNLVDLVAKLVRRRRARLLLDEFGRSRDGS